MFENNKDNSNNYSNNVSFILEILKTFQVKNIDFLACQSLEYTTWKKYYELLHYYTQTIVGASNDLTGNINYGGDWIMETTNEDIQNMYFNNNITNYSDTLASSSLSISVINGNASYNMFSFKVKNISVDYLLTIKNLSNIWWYTSTFISNPRQKYLVYLRPDPNSNGLTPMGDETTTNFNLSINPSIEYELFVVFDTTYYAVYDSTQNKVDSDSFLKITAYKSWISSNPSTSSYINNNVVDLVLDQTLSPYVLYDQLTTNAPFIFYHNMNYEYKKIPTITNFSIPSKIFDDAPFSIEQPTSDSSAAFTFTSSNTNVATISASSTLPQFDLNATTTTVPTSDSTNTYTVNNYNSRVTAVSDGIGYVLSFPSEGNGYLYIGGSNGISNSGPLRSYCTLSFWVFYDSSCSSGNNSIVFQSQWWPTYFTQGKLTTNIYYTGDGPVNNTN